MGSVATARVPGPCRKPWARSPRQSRQARAASGSVGPCRSWNSSEGCGVWDGQGDEGHY